MSSGYGAKTKNGRCFPLWINFQKCMSRSIDPVASGCKAAADDYMECLHRRKQVCLLLQIKLIYVDCMVA